MREPTLAPDSALALWVAVARPQILAIACGAALTYGWLMTGRWLGLAVLLCAVDWFVVNLMNRVADLDEDRRNGIAGTGLMAAHGRAVELGCGALALASLAVGHAIAPALTPWRIAFTLIGLAYNYRVLPGRRRFKELYFWKNFMSGVLFVISTVAYPAVIGQWPLAWPWLTCLVAFYLPLEITYEVIYDLRDVAGDRALGVPTYPVVHGEVAAAWIVRGLLVASVLGLAAGAVWGGFRLKELAMLGGPIQQALFFEWVIRKRGATPARTTLLTWLGAAQIASYHLWIVAGLPVEWPT